MRKDGRRFGRTGIISVVAVIVILALIGWSYFAGQKDDSSPQSGQPGTTQNNTTNTNNNGTNTQQDEPDDSYLVVKEWGIKIPQDKDGSISYRISTSDKNQADFISSEQKALGGKCGSFGFARYQLFRAGDGYRSNDRVRQIQLDYAAESDLAVQANGMTYYILGNMSGGDCTGKLKAGESISSQEITANDNLLNALKELTAAK